MINGEIWRSGLKYVWERDVNPGSVEETPDGKVFIESLSGVQEYDKGSVVLDDPRSTGLDALPSFLPGASGVDFWVLAQQEAQNKVGVYVLADYTMN